MHSNNNELVSYGHRLAAAIGDVELREVAQVITALATQLDVTTAAVREMTKKRDADHADVLSWEKTMFKVCGEDGFASVADKFKALQAERDQLAAENVHLREQIMCWARECDRITYRHTNKITDSHQKECEGDLKNIETPATDRFLAEQQSIGIQKAAASGLFSNWVNQSLISFAITVRNGDDFAAQLRNEVKV